MTLILPFVERLIATLPARRKTLFNPWKDTCAHDTPQNTLEQKLDRLARHLDCDARYLLIGEAPGYQGCRYSGVPFTSERLLLDGAIPRISKIEHRLSTRDRPFSEPSATIVWKTLYQLGIAEQTVMWNALQLHPFVQGSPWTNRTPKLDELAIGFASLRMLQLHFPRTQIVAVGRKASEVLGQLKISHTQVRHPANGGARQFANGLATIVAGAR